MRNRLAAVLLVVAAVLAFVRYGPYVGLEGALMPDQPHAHGHDDVVLRVEESPGMGTVETFFSAPDLVVTGDGTAYVAGGGSPAGVVHRIRTFRIGEAGVQSLLKQAAHDRLLADHPDYPSSSGVMDGGDTSVLLVTSRGRWTHSAYALDAGSGLGFTARARLADFVGQTRVVAASRSTTYVAPALRIMATPVEGADGSGPVGAWPAVAGVVPGEIGACTVVTDPAVVHALTTSSDRLYRAGGTTYAVAAAVLLPGDSCGPAVAS
jgi:hypothetical protein